MIVKKDYFIKSKKENIKDFYTFVCVHFINNKKI
jgi:hypothetical protein